jgi:hypothetical protein
MISGLKTEQAADDTAICARVTEARRLLWRVATTHQPFRLSFCEVRLW